MKNHFSRITDAARLRVGDIIVLPTEKDRKSKSVHVSASSFTKMGVSHGLTSRSVNSTEAVHRLLVDDTGATRLLYIAKVNLVGYNDNLEMFRGNNVNFEPKISAINSACVRELPGSGSQAPEIQEYLRKKFLNAMRDTAEGMLRGKLTWLSVINGEGYSFKDDDRFIKAAFEHPRLNTLGYKWNSINKLLPSIPKAAEKGDTCLLNHDEINEFLGSSQLFNTNLSSINDENMMLNLPKRFFVNFEKKGAIFVRPSYEYINDMVFECLSQTFEEYVKTCDMILTYATRLEEGLKKDVALMKERKSTIKSLVKSIATEKTVRDEVSNQFKELLTWQ